MDLGIRMKYKAFGLVIESDIELALPSVEATITDVFIRKTGITMPFDETTKLHRKGLSATSAQLNGAYYLNWENCIKFKAEAGNVLWVDTTITDLDFLNLFILSEALGLILLQRGLFLLHGSSINIDNEATVFLGEPGMGKSTTAAGFIKYGCQLLTDDLVALRIDNEANVWVVPAYPQLKIWENTVEGLNFDKNTLKPTTEGTKKYIFDAENHYCDKQIRLKQVFILSESPTETVNKINFSIELVGHFPLPEGFLQGEVLKKHFRDSVKISQTAMLYKQQRFDSFIALNQFIEQMTLTSTAKHEK